MRSRKTLRPHLVLPVWTACLCLGWALPGHAGEEARKPFTEITFELENTGTLVPKQTAGEAFVPLSRVDAYFQGEAVAAAVGYGAAEVPGGEADARVFVGGQSGVAGSDGRRHELHWHVEPQHETGAEGGDPGITVLKSHRYGRDLLKPDSVHYLTVNREHVAEYKHSELPRHHLKKRRSLNPAVRLMEDAVAGIENDVTRKQAKQASNKLTPYDLSEMVSPKATATHLEVRFPRHYDETDEMRALVFFDDGSIIPLLGFESKGALNVPESPAGPRGLAVTDVEVDWGDDPDEFRFVVTCQNPQGGPSVYSYDFEENAWNALFGHEEHRRPARVAVNWKTGEVVVAFDETGSVFYRQGFEEGEWEEIMPARAFPIRYHDMVVRWNKKEKPQIVLGAEIPGTRYIRFVYFNGRNLFPCDWKPTRCTSPARHARIEASGWPEVYDPEESPSIAYFVSWPQHDDSFLGIWDRSTHVRSVLWDGDADDRDTATGVAFDWDEENGRLRQVLLGFDEGDVKTYAVRKHQK